MIYIIEGMDNCLKDTLIQLLRSHLTPQTQILKFSSPPENISAPENWQKRHFKDMFDLITLSLNNSTRNIILNRAHLGEYVYSPIYRGYEGGWIFDLEQSFLKSANKHLQMIRLFVLFDSDNVQLKKREDGKSLSGSDSKNMDRERQRFIKAFEKSKIPSKRIFNLSDFTIKGGYGEQVKIDVDLIIKLMLQLQ